MPRFRSIRSGRRLSTDAASPGRAGAITRPEATTSAPPSRSRRGSPTSSRATESADGQRGPFGTPHFGLPSMKLLLEIAWTHVTTRIRQTLVGILGVAMGVGFTIMIAGLMEGGQRDFIRQLVDTLPHVTVSDERRASPVQPAEREYAAVQVTNMPSAERRTGIKNPTAVVAS